MRYKCIDLGHTERLIQERLDKLPLGYRLLSVLWIGTSVIGILERDPKMMIPKK